MRAAAGLALLAAACAGARGGSANGPAAATAAATVAPTDAACADAPVTAFPGEPVFARCVGANVVFYNHADPALDGARVVAQLQAQYGFLRDLVGGAPRWIIAHAGNDYACGHARADGPFPELFLIAATILDTRCDYAHEMTHCFNAQFGRLPHWFDESLADAMYFESEVQLYHRRQPAEFLPEFLRVDHRSYELMQLRARYGEDWFRAVYGVLRARAAECRALMNGGAALEARNRFLLAVLGEAAGEDLLPLFQREFGFNPRTRERQRGY